MLADGQFLESAEVAGNLYGTPRSAVLARLRAGRPVLLRTDPAGAWQVRERAAGELVDFLGCSFPTPA